MALIVVAIVYATYRMARYVFEEQPPIRTALMICYVGGILDTLAVLLLGIIVGTLWG